MAFETFEESLQSGEPIELYKFTRQNYYWYFTSTDKDFTHDGQVWLAQPISRSSLEVNAGEERSELKITVPRDNEVAKMFVASAPSDMIGVTVYRLHSGDTDEKVIWIGRVLAVEWRGSEVVFDCEPANISLLRTGLRRLYSKQCAHRLYGQGCEVNRQNYNVTVALTSVNGDVISSNSFGSMATNYLAGGILEYSTGNGLIERRMIMSNSGNNAVISNIIPGLASGATVVVAPGCDHTTGAAGCAKFNNLLNYGGFPYIPVKNPHGGEPIS